MDAGVDSIGVREFTASLEAEIGVSVPPTLLFDYPTIGKVAEYIEENVFESTHSKLVALESRVMINGADIQIGIVGMSCRFPGSSDSPGAFWDMLVAGKDGVIEVPKARWDVDAFFDPDRNAVGKMYTKEGGFVTGLDMFDARQFGISPAEARQLDPQQRMLLEVGYDALHRSGYTRETLAGRSVGVFVGATTSGFDDVVGTGVDSISPYSATGSNTAVASNRLSYALGLEGPSLTVDTACSSSLVAMNLACQALRNGDCEIALVAGVNVMVHPLPYIATCRAGMLSPTGRCRTFDAGADGYCRAEGCGAVVLTRQDLDATAPCYGLVKAVAVNQDGRSAGLTAPNGLAQQSMHKRALELAGDLKPSDVSVIETHGTGTSLGDPIEVGAIKAVYGNDDGRESPLVLGAVKSNVGHLEAAAGMAGLIKLILSLGYRHVPANLHMNEVNPAIDFDGLSAVLPSEGGVELPKTGRVIGGVSSFGFGGTNAHVLIESVEPLPPIRKEDAGVEQHGEPVVYDRQQFAWKMVTPQSLERVVHHEEKSNADWVYCAEWHDLNIDGSRVEMTGDWVVIDRDIEEVGQPSFVSGSVSVRAVSNVHEASDLIGTDNINGVVYITRSESARAMSVGDELLALGKLVCNAGIFKLVVVTERCTRTASTKCHPPHGEIGKASVFSFFFSVSNKKNSDEGQDQTFGLNQPLSWTGQKKPSRRVVGRVARCVHTIKFANTTFTHGVHDILFPAPSPFTFFFRFPFPRALQKTS